mmetsp:Transcript_5122/g.6620  ORF Transcript_5122/g.6620 Transcript_5122/m.6620 type:complete len:197 (-) Transcript_5122:272-862(-)
MTIVSLSIISGNESGSDELLYIKEFQSERQTDENDYDFESDLFQLEEGEGTSSKADSNPNPTPGSNSCSLHHQFLLQAALEKINQEIKFDNRLRVTFKRQFSDSDYMWVGFICPIESFHFYGYITNTNIKIIVAVEDNILPEQEQVQKKRDDELKAKMISIHACYVDHIQNPFSDKRGKIKSRRFDERISRLVSSK